MKVQVLNACGEEPLQTVSLNHAIRMILRDVATIHEVDPNVYFAGSPRPRSVRLERYIYMGWRFNRPPRWSRRGVLVRDGHTCGYCGAYGDTVDHILPISRGGERTSWTNTLACCGRCNARKANKLLTEVGMRLRSKPFVPTWAQIHASAA